MSNSHSKSESVFVFGQLEMHVADHLHADRLFHHLRGIQAGTFLRNNLGRYRRHVGLACEALLGCMENREGPVT